MIKSLVFEKKYWIVRHLLFWLTLYLMEFFGLLGISDYFVNVESSGQEAIDAERKAKLMFLFAFFLDVALIYINIYFLLPKFLLKNRIWEYLLYTGLTMLLVLGLNYWEEILNYVHESNDWIYFFYESFLFTLSVLATAVAIKTAKVIYFNGKREAELTKLKTDAEINALKQQINPHFLFNSLNNLYILAKTKDDTLPDQMLKLSDLMRYQTYETSKDKIKLSKEIEFLENYLDLEKMRRTNLQVNISATQTVKNLMIEPLIFLPFVENACKHSHRIDGQASEIKLDWTLENKVLKFRATNSQGNSDIKKMEEFSGFGLDNIIARLILLFPEKHDLKINDTSSLYEVSLDLEI